MIDAAVRRSQVYYFLSHAFLYPQDCWLEQLPDLFRILEDLGVPCDWDSSGLSDRFDLPDLQSQHRLAFGLTGSQCYETEFGLPHEFRQSQELADIAGFYQAFGFRPGGTVRERPDHLATELEFMYVLALKQAYALQQGLSEQAEITLDAQRKFLQDHLARWLPLFSRSLNQSAEQRLGSGAASSPYLQLARLAEVFVAEDASHLDVHPEAEPQAELKLTPFDPDFSCAGCAVADPAS